MNIETTVNLASPKVVSVSVNGGCSAGASIGSGVQKISVTQTGGIAALDVAAFSPMRRIDVQTFDPVSMNARLEDHIAREIVHGTESPVVGTTDSQTLDNKTIDCGTY